MICLLFSLIFISTFLWILPTIFLFASLIKNGKRDENEILIIINFNKSYCISVGKWHRFSFSLPKAYVRDINRRFFFFVYFDGNFIMPFTYLRKYQTQKHHTRKKLIISLPCHFSRAETKKKNRRHKSVNIDGRIVYYYYFHSNNTFQILLQNKSLYQRNLKLDCQFPLSIFKEKKNIN